MCNGMNRMAARRRRGSIIERIVLVTDEAQVSAPRLGGFACVGCCQFELVRVSQEHDSFRFILEQDCARPHLTPVPLAQKTESLDKPHFRK